MTACRWLALFILAFSPTILCRGAASSSALNDDIRTLKLKLSKTGDGNRLAIIDKISTLNWNTPTQEYWQRKLYEESVKCDSMNTANEALADLACYYYNNEMDDRLRWCSLEADRLALLNGRYYNGYFSTKFFSCQRDLWDGRYADAISHAKDFYAKAMKSDNLSGKIRFHELMGLIYQMLERYHLAYSYMDKAVGLQRSFNGHEAGRMTQLLSDLIEIGLKLDNMKSVKHNIDELYQIQIRVDKMSGGKENSFPTERNRRMACAYYIEYFVKTKKYPEAKYYLLKATMMKQSDVYVDFLINHASALYYQGVKNYSEALKYIDLTIAADDSSTVEYLVDRAEILSDMGRHTASEQAFRLALRKQSENTKNGFDKEVASLQNVYSNMQMKLNLKQAEMERERFERELISAVALFLLIAVLALVAFLVYNNRIRKHLQRDKDEMHSTDIALKKALTRADEVNKLKDSFMHNISHEIRTPLNSIVGFSNIIAESEKDNGDYAEYCRIIGENNDALLSVVNNLVDLSIYQSTDFSIINTQLEQVEISSLCRKALDFVRMSGKLKNTVELSFSGNPDPFTIHTFPQYLNKIILNLLMNAVKYTSKGSICLSYHLIDDGRRVEFSVADTGIGIKPEARESIFDSFEKAGSFIQGMGLGLTICRELITKLGGEIHVDSEYTQGARFVFVVNVM
jgi:signal transduction histidine kinase